MKILFFLCYSRDQASSRTRGFYVAEELKKKGIDCDIICGYGKKIYAKFLLKFLNYDIIYFQKRFIGIDIKLNKLARLMGKKTIFDIDDAPGRISLNTEAEIQAIEMMKNCSAVIVGSHKLKEFAQRFNNYVYILLSPIDLNYYKLRKRNESVDYTTLGWVGNCINYKNDLLTILKKPIEEIGKKYRIKLTIICFFKQKPKEISQGFGKIKNVEVEIIDSLNGAIPNLIPSAISKFDIGLYPLLNNEYNKFKCGFKGLEYMAVGIPVVSSAVAENRLIIENGKDGFLVTGEEEWKERLSFLIENESIRKKMGEKGRKKIEEKYSLEVYADKLINIFKEI